MENIQVGEFQKFPSIIDLFKKKKFVTMCAPMVRYSKLPFRLLVRKYACDVAFTPMIISHSFIESVKARDTDFTTNCDRPLIVQFAARNGQELAEAAEIAYSSSDGVDLNCGCPQRWALADGYGACLLDKPDLVHDMIYQVRNRLPDSKYSISLKIRIHDDIRKTVEVCRRAEKAGATFISIHGRTKLQRNEPINLDGIKLIKSCMKIPIVGNGDVFHLKDAMNFQNATNVDGVMSARGLLQNPSLFTGTDVTPIECIKHWIYLSLSYGVAFTNMHHHLMFMLEKNLPKSERKYFNSFNSLSAVLDYLDNYI
ncbi:tRNA-dihydrouridine(20a/20b) synthase [NAD(P)+]-like isoform X2 [Uloborus diversus]|uniref:tRNA-dihydrouridine(20a/20b) synthase [NAD(P)+]-like isoform X2 n=1 Tax=Uloborus diversus TaxID=327109 RepID=UPI00240A7B6A|nr:tRNA-dihydrouridine(20a/20b) synthase [NAD(P)+]-like isoform X2 [Uloborus diversus]